MIEIYPAVPIVILTKYTPRCTSHLVSDLQPIYYQHIILQLGRSLWHRQGAIVPQVQEAFAPYRGYKVGDMELWMSMFNHIRWLVNNIYDAFKHPY